MKKPIRLIIGGFACSILYSFIAVDSTDNGESVQAVNYSATKVWESDKVFKVPESVIYDSKRRVLYIANINGGMGAKDGNGFISRVTLEGQINDLEWITGLDAPKGSSIKGDNLFIADIDKLVEIDLNNGVILNKYPAASAKLLNDVAIDDEGTVYVSDMVGDKIFQLRDGEMSEWLEVPGPNGIIVEGESLVIASFKRAGVLRVNLADKSVTKFADGFNRIDGLVPDGKGNYFISDWNGKTSLLRANGEVVDLLDTTADRVRTADIEFILSESLLLIPTFGDNRVMAYRIR